MSGRRILLAILLVDFVAFTAWAVWQHGIQEFFTLHTANAVGLQVFADLVIALSLILVWMWRDARSRGVSPYPYVLLTLTLGSIGPLAYLVLREETSPAIAPSRLAVQAR